MVLISLGVLALGIAPFAILQEWRREDADGEIRQVFPALEYFIMVGCLLPLAWLWAGIIFEFPYPNTGWRLWLCEISSAGLAILAYVVFWIRRTRKRFKDHLEEWEEAKRKAANR